MGRLSGWLFSRGVFGGRAAAYSLSCKPDVKWVHASEAVALVGLAFMQGRGTSRRPADRLRPHHHIPCPSVPQTSAQLPTGS